MQSPLKWQTRVVSCFTASQNAGFAVGSIEGRVAIQYVEEKDSRLDIYHWDQWNQQLTGS